MEQTLKSQKSPELWIHLLFCLTLLWKLRTPQFAVIKGGMLVFLVVISEKSCRVSDVVNNYFQSNSISSQGIVQSRHTNKGPWESERTALLMNADDAQWTLTMKNLFVKHNVLHYFTLFSLIVVSSLSTNTIKEADQTCNLKFVFSCCLIVFSELCEWNLSVRSMPWELILLDWK